MNSKQIMSINIPNDWSFVPIYDLRNKNDRYSFTGGPFGSDLKSEHYTDSGVRVIQLQNIGEGKFYNDNKVFTSEEKANQLKTCLIYPDEIILAKMFPAGRSCKIPRAEEKFLMCSDGIRLSVDRSKYDNDFVFQALNTSYFLKAVQSQSTGTTRSRIGLNDLKIIPIAIPNSIIEQQKIADILTTVDHKLENIESQIAEYTNLKTGLMQQLLTKGIVHTKFVDSELGMIPEGWEVMKLGKCIDLLTGFPFKSNEFSLNIKHTRLLRGINITEGSIRWNNEINRYWENITVELKKYFLSEDDLVISMDGSKVGKNYALVKKEELPLLLVQRVARIRPKSNLIIKYLYFIISSSHFLKYVESVKTSSGIPHISSKQINEFEILLPPKNEQQKIADILSSIEDKLDSLQVNKTECNKLKRGLMEQLLTGRIRVKV